MMVNGEIKMTDEVEYSCDKWVWRKIHFPGKYSGRCGRKVYCEVYPRQGSWSYLCRRHYILDRIKCFIHRKRNGYCMLNGN